MISKQKQLEVFALQANPYLVYEENLKTLIRVIKENEDTGLIVASEVFLTGFDYANMEKAASFGKEVLDLILPYVNNQVVVFSLIVNENNGFVNQAVVLYKNQIVYKQNKAKLFHLGNEHIHFAKGDDGEIKPFMVDGVLFAILICFELRFKDLWRQIEGAEVVIIPAQWGEARCNHFIILAQALAVMNQCFVVACSNGDNEITNSSFVVNPNGEIEKENIASGVFSKLNLRSIATMRRYIAMER